ncbi:hepatic lectin-like [Lissotriton helveticus]
MRKTSQTEDKKMLSTKKLVDLGLVISLLLLATLIARVTLYSTVTARAQLTQETLARLESNLSLAMKYIGCKERTSGTDCWQFFYQVCPTDWLLYNGKCYFFSQNTLTWDGSRSECLTSQADLLIINDQMEQLFISNKTKNESLWIGLTDRDQEGVWKWVKGLSLQSEAFWGCNQPDNSDNSGNAEDCATVGSITYCGGASSRWNDARCEKKYKFICEKEAEDRKMDFPT